MSGIGYAGFCPECSRIVFVAAHDDPARVACSLASAALSGLQIRSRPIEEIRAGDFGHVAGCAEKARRREAQAEVTIIADRGTREVVGAYDNSDARDWLATWSEAAEPGEVIIFMKDEVLPKEGSP